MRVQNNPIYPKKPMPTILTKGVATEARVENPFLERDMRNKNTKMIDRAIKDTLDDSWIIGMSAEYDGSQPVQLDAVDYIDSPFDDIVSVHDLIQSTHKATDLLITDPDFYPVA